MASIPEPHRMRQSSAAIGAEREPVATPANASEIEYPSDI